MKKLIYLALVLVLGMSFISVQSAADYDFGGETITIWDLGDFGDAQWVFEEGEILAGRIEEAEAKFNVNIELDSDPSVHERLLAGDSTHDIWLQPHQVLFPVEVAHGYKPEAILAE